jgi:hypothetical protein
MSRGYGKIQRAVLALWQKSHGSSTTELATAIYATNKPNNAQLVSIRRAITKLVAEGAIKRRRVGAKRALLDATERFRGLELTARLQHVRLSLNEANAFVQRHHRHHKPVVGHIFSLGCVKEGKIVGVAIVGRPVSRMRDDGLTAEVTRLCTDGTRNACSFLYGASARAAFALGFKRIGTYILADERGRSLIASGWRLIGEAGGGSWSVPSRPRVDKHPTEDKVLFETTA